MFTREQQKQALEDYLKYIDSGDIEDQECCDSCNWFELTDCRIGEEDSDTDPWMSCTVMGKCHRYPPSDEGFPSVSGATWCGEHQPNDSFGTFKLRLFAIGSRKYEGFGDVSISRQTEATK